MSKAITVIIPTHNRPQALLQCIRSLSEQTVSPSSFDILIVSDGPTEYEAADLALSRPVLSDRIRVLQQEPRGPASARNLGIRKAHTPFVAFIDDDCIADPAWLDHLVAAFENNNCVGVEGRVLPRGEVSPITHQVSNQGGQYLTANIAYARSWLVDYGGFDEAFRYPACEDYDLAWRIIEGGGCIRYEPRAIVYHPARAETLSEFAGRLRQWDAPRQLYRKHPESFRERCVRSPLANDVFYALVQPPYQFWRWRAQILGNPRLAALLGVRVILQMFYGCTMPMRRLLGKTFSEPSLALSRN